MKITHYLREECNFGRKTKYATALTWKQNSTLCCVVVSPVKGDIAFRMLSRYERKLGAPFDLKTGLEISIAVVTATLLLRRNALLVLP